MGRTKFLSKVGFGAVIGGSNGDYYNSGRGSGSSPLTASGNRYGIDLIFPTVG